MLTLVTGVMISGLSPVQSMNSPAPDISSQHWLNSEPLDWSKLKGKVVLVEFWTFECYNCQHVEPYVKLWYKQFHAQGFEIVAVHSPEFERERNIDNVRDYIKQHGITYPVAIDNEFTIWRRFNNRYWPSLYLVDKHGAVRQHTIGEGNYSFIENKIQELLAEEP